MQPFLKPSNPQPQWLLRSDAALWRSPLGVVTLAWEQTVLRTFAERVFGYYALGFALTGLDLWQDCAVSHRLTFGLEVQSSLESEQKSAQAQAKTSSQSNAYAAFDLIDWPIQNDSLDYIVLPHVLEFACDPHAVLREAARCIRPGGAISIVGFNPNSMLALQSSRAGLGKASHWISRQRLVDWLQLLDLHTDRGAFGQWRPLCQQANRFQQLHWLDDAGERWWPQMANVYAMRVVKRVSPDLRQFDVRGAKKFARAGLAVARKTVVHTSCINELAAQCDPIIKAEQNTG